MDDPGLAVGLPEVKPSVFVSYSRRNVYLAEEVARGLHPDRFDVFFDLARLRPGEDWQEPLFSKIANCDVFVFVATPDALDPDGYARDELDWAIEKRRAIVLVTDRACCPRVPCTAPTYRLGRRAQTRAFEDAVAGAAQANEQWRGARFGLPSPAVAGMTGVLGLGIIAGLLSGVSQAALAMSAYGQVAEVFRVTGRRMTSGAGFFAYALAWSFFCLALGACLVSLVRGRWRWGYAAPLLAAGVFGVGAPISQTLTLTRLSRNVAYEPVPAPAVLAETLARPIELVGLLVVALVPLVIGSRSVLWRSVPGAGSFLARFRLYLECARRGQLPVADVDAVLPALLRVDEGSSSVVVEGSFCIRESDDEALRARLARALEKSGLTMAQTSPDLKLEILRFDSPQAPSEPGVVPVLAWRAAIDKNHELLRRQFLDFRRFRVDALALRRVLAPKVEVALPVDIVPRPDAWSVPMSVNHLLVTLAVSLVPPVLFGLREGLKQGSVAAAAMLAAILLVSGLVARQRLTWPQVVAAVAVLGVAQLSLALAVWLTPGRTWVLDVPLVLIAALSALGYVNSLWLQERLWFRATGRNSTRVLAPAVPLLPLIPYLATMAAFFVVVGAFLT